jgi:glycosyltransferase involved in cell wall biosynthesis
VIPAHDEAGAIAAVVRDCLGADLRVREVIVVDDGSTDDTGPLAERAGARVLRSTSNRGKGHALRVGAAAATGDVLVFLDGDGQDDPRDLPRLLDAIAQGADLAIGSRFLGSFDPGAITAVDRLGNRLLTAALNRLFGAALTDSQAGYRAIRCELFARVRLTALGYDVETELLVRALRAGARVVEVPVRRAARRAGTSDLASVRDGVRILRRMIELRLEDERVR